jgi:ATP-binding cassette subfamily B protein
MLNSKPCIISLIDMDPLAEADVFKKFREISYGKISLIVSHRIGSVRLSSRIIFMDNGEIVED